MLCGSYEFFTSFSRDQGLQLYDSCLDRKTFERTRESNGLPVVEEAKPYLEFSGAENYLILPHLLVYMQEIGHLELPVEGMYVMAFVYLHIVKHYLMIRSYQQETGSQVAVPPVNLRLK